MHATGVNDLCDALGRASALRHRSTIYDIVVDDVYRNRLRLLVVVRRQPGSVTEKHSLLYWWWIRQLYK
jgi:hypothetical protein